MKLSHTTLADLPRALPPGKRPRSQITIARLGTYKDKRYGTFQISQKDVDGWSRNLSDTFGGKVAIDYDHSSDRGRGSKAAAWLTGLHQEGKDVIADVEWTPAGAKAVRNGSYQRLSPTFTERYTDEYGTDQGRALIGGALTNRPVPAWPTCTVVEPASTGCERTPSATGRGSASLALARGLQQACERSATDRAAPHSSSRLESVSQSSDRRNDMHAVVVKVSISDADGSESALREQVVPEVAQAPGFVTGYWTRKDNTGLSMVIFESEEAANGMSERVRSIAPAGVTVEDVEVREVVAHA